MSGSWKGKKVECCCGWKGKFGELEEDESKQSLVCPRCGTVGWSFS